MANTSVIVIPEGKICDYVDGKFRNDTPEEYVRQTIEKRLVNEHKYLPKQIRIEYTLQLGSRKPRADIVIFDKDCGEQTQENIKIIIECKKEAVEARNAKDGVEQLKSYMSACPNCEWGMWTNGRQKEVYHKYVNDKGQIDFMDYNDIPSADGNLDDINRPKRTTLKNAYGAVVDEIDDSHVRNIPIPLLKNHDIQKRINALALEANQKRYEAYKLEQKALEIMDKEVIYAK